MKRSPGIHGVEAATARRGDRLGLAAVAGSREGPGPSGLGGRQRGGSGSTAQPPRGARRRADPGGGALRGGDEGVVLEQLAVERSVEVAERPGVGPAGVRSDGRRSSSATPGRGEGFIYTTPDARAHPSPTAEIPDLEAVDAGLELAVRRDPDE